MNCQDCVQLLDRYVDRELSEAEIVHVQRHMAACGDCENRYDFQAELKRLVRTSCCRDRVPEGLRQRVGKLFG